MIRNQTVRGTPPDGEMQAKAAALVGEVGDRQAAKRLRITRATLARVVAGFPLMPATLAFLREGLAGYVPQPKETSE